ncbi:aldo/keto reductase [Christiangramia salexigens]|uniref:Alcohol dehydrogenase n=1 Tax=Christiangramia salexigens TaxID=1913577 RepID=A0A1L3J3I5_9FLAO|nr:aldo/keto reductase [Christiangramia salexigens]APG59687.1 alcohol dehydrogenase [Christiangramia salexigens]
MIYKKLGNTDLQTPPIIFGGNVFGWTLDEKESFRMLDQLLDLGFNMIDTADVYSRWAKGNPGGESERIIGNYFKARNNRDKITLITKVGSSMIQGGKADISRDHILKAAEDSLRRLQTDHIDLYFTHKDDKTTPVEETLGAYQTLIKQGKLRYIGASNLSAERLKLSLEASSNHSLPKYEVIQPEYNLLVRDKFEGEIRDLCRDYNLGVTGYFSLASGFLTGKYKSLDQISGTERERFLKNYFNDKGLRVLQAVKNIAEKHKISASAIALKWIMQRPYISAPIASATKPEHLNSFKEALKTELDQEDMQRLNDISAY